MAYQAYFKRYEIKFLLDSGQKQRLLQAMIPHMARDQYGRVTIRNLYYDTSHYQMIRRSLEKPVYKEKLRLRSYCRCEAGDTVFVEMKKKYKGIVYKRRLLLPREQAMAWLAGGAYPGPSTQISREITQMLAHYRSLEPRVFLSYEREAYYCLAGGDLRITLDENVLCRREALCLGREPGGRALLPEGMTLLEIKTPGGLPLWLTSFLSREKLYKTSFSKYGTAYQRMIMPNFKGECLHA